MTDIAANGRPSWRDVLSQLNFVEQRLEAKIDNSEKNLAAQIRAMDDRLSEFEVEEAIKSRRTRDITSILGGARGLTLIVIAGGSLILGVANFIR